ncbi:CHAT domain-containing protein [Nocardia sp. NPDC060259]|uniref:CHAT domain-containing protein n=1 Tax=Nocardia sp. NPDC060259 TaxID=3347088 RepID=UPI003656F861
MGIFRRRNTSQFVLLSALSDDEVAQLKIVERTFDLMGRPAFFAHDAEFVLETLRSTSAQTSSAITQLVVGIAADELASIVDRTGLQIDEAKPFAAASRGATGLRTALETLTRCADDQRAYQVDSAATSAVVQAILLTVERIGDNHGSSEPLCVAAAAAHDVGRTELLEQVLSAAGRRQHSPGYTALFAFYHTQLPAVRMKPAEFTRLRTECKVQLHSVTWSDPARHRVLRIAHWLSENENGRQRSAISQAAAAAEAADYAAAAHWYGLATSDAETPGQAGLFRLFSEIFRLRVGQLETPSDFRASMLRLASDHVTKAKPLFPVDDAFADYGTTAAAVDHAHPGSNLAIQVTDFIGDVRAGVALDHNLADLATVAKSLSDTSIVDALQRDPQLINASDLKIAIPGAAFVWVEIIHDTSDPVDPALSGNHIRVLTLPATSDRSTVRNVALTHRQSALFTRSRNEESEVADPSEIAWLEDLIFKDLDAADSPSGVFVIPDGTAWELPWIRIIPNFVDQFSIIPSAAAALRLQPPPPTAARRIVSYFDAGMEGAAVEHAALVSLHAERRIDYRAANSLAELHTILSESSFDVLTIAAHGSFSSGIEFVMNFGTEKVPLLAFLELPLPPVVNLGCCWSGRTSLNNNSIAAALATIAGGASLALGGVWEIDDRTSGALLADAYQRYADGLPFAQAVLAASRQLDPVLQPLTGALGLFGRW